MKNSSLPGLDFLEDPLWYMMPLNAMCGVSGPDAAEDWVDV